MFATKEGEDIITNVTEEGKQIEAQKVATENGHKKEFSEEQKAEISRAIEAATTKEEMDLIEKQLKVRDYINTSILEMCVNVMSCAMIDGNFCF